MKIKSIVAAAITGVAVLIMAGIINMPLKSRVVKTGATSSLNLYQRSASATGSHLAMSFYAEK